ncbi:hypothetical protein KIS4809_3140 [Bacillus sp. ZZV12-4809]|nr:hypothetical protein KIS4809_3140 [Bacillus sp. ZZV12-4809]
MEASYEFAAGLCMKALFKLELHTGKGRDRCFRF